MGAVTTVDRNRGRLSLGGATVDYTALLGNTRFSAPKVGDVVRIVGTQPSGRDLILAGRIDRTQDVNAGGQALGSMLAAKR